MNLNYIKKTFTIRKKASDEKSSIKFNRENMIRCLCVQCPVQKESECAQNKMKMLQISMRGMSPEPEEFPGMYCATGKAVCNDLNKNKNCICIECEVWKENKLELKEPTKYFCQNGKAN